MYCVFVQISISLILIVLVNIIDTFPQMYLVDTDPVGGYRSQKSRLRLNTDIILMQRDAQKETTYHLADEPNAHPLFTRAHRDLGKKYVFFHHPNFPPGSGQFIVLKKMERQRRQDGLGNNFFYECFVLSFKDTLHGSVSDLDPSLYQIYKTNDDQDHSYPSKSASNINNLRTRKNRRGK